MRVSPAVSGLVVLASFAVSLGAARSEEATVNLGIKTVRVKPAAVAGWVTEVGRTGLAGILGAQQREQFLAAVERANPRAVESFATVVRSGERASVDVVREFPVPDNSSTDGVSERRFAMRDVGMRLAVTPTVAGTGAVDCRLELTRSSLDGFAVTGDAWQPKFGEAEVKTAVTVGGGESALLNLGSSVEGDDGELTLVLITPVVAGTTNEWSGDPKSQVEIESMFVELSDSVDRVSEGVLGAEQFAEMVRGLDRVEGVDLMSAPKVTTKVGQKATINIVREFRYPTVFDPPTGGESWTPTQFETRNTGVTLEVEPRADERGKVELVIEAEVVDFEGFINYGALSAPRLLSNGKFEAAEGAGGSVINQPIFEARRAASRVSVGSGETLVLGGLTRWDDQTVESGPAAVRTSETEKVRKTLFVFVTPRWVDSEGKVMSTKAAEVLVDNPTPAPLPSAPVPQTRTDFPYGTPVPNKPGFVTSPHATDAGYVDLRGFPPGTEVKCPYSGKLFLAP